MQIVIDIPNDIKDTCDRFSVKCLLPEMVYELYLAIRMGIVLPKNHGRLIDATDLLEICEFKETEREVSGAQTVVPGAWEWGKESKYEIQGWRQG